MAEQIKEIAVTAIALFSGGLDSILSCRLVASLGIRVKALRFVTPFFGYDLWLRKEEYERETLEKYGIDVQLIEVSEPYMAMLADPPHGYGKNFNPCLDCKIMLASFARREMERIGASFMISGEVVGQRPMSQRRDAMRVVERDSGCDDILLRPLCAKNLSPTRPEREGLIDREMLLGFSGRGRKQQISLAERFAISDYPAPAGGCVLTDPILAARIRQYYASGITPKVDDFLFIQVGRQFRLPGGAWLSLGRNQEDNQRVEALFRPGDFILRMDDWPGPSGLLRHGTDPGDRTMAAAILKRFAKKGPEREGRGVEFYDTPAAARPVDTVHVAPRTPTECEPFML